MRVYYVMVAVLLIALAMIGNPQPSRALMRTTASPTGLAVQGNRLVNDSGATVQLQGVMLSQLEYSCQDNNGEYRAASYPALRAWHVNAVKIPINPNYWDGQGCNAASYHQQVYSAVDTALGQGMYVLLSLLAFEPGQGDKTSGPTSLDTWAQVGGHYAADTRVLYETFSEMHDISDSEWQTNTQALINDLNAHAPHSVVLANSDNWGGTIGNLWSAGYRVTGKNLGFSVHLYDNGGNVNAANWPASFGNLAAQYPMVAGEFGSNTGSCGQDFLAHLMPYMLSHISGWFAWEWNPDSANYCNRPALLVDNTASLVTGQPSNYGQIIHDFYVQDGLMTAPAPPPIVPPVTPPLPAVTAPGFVCSDPYIVKTGDTLAGIAATIPATVDTLAWVNNLRNQLLFVGQTLCLGGIQPTCSLTNQCGRGAAQLSNPYIVQPGDTLWRIAQRYGTTVAALAALNHLADPNLIFPGQQIVVYGSSPAVTPLTFTPPAATYPNYFPIGQCTWYVQSQRPDLLLQGNAEDLGRNAARRGYPVTTTPRIGAVIVFQARVDGASWLGHAGIVVAIAGDWVTIREMNFYGLTALNGGPSGFDTVDQRSVYWPVSGISFID